MKKIILNQSQQELLKAIIGLTPAGAGDESVLRADEIKNKLASNKGDYVLMEDADYAFLRNNMRQPIFRERTDDLVAFIKAIHGAEEFDVNKVAELRAIGEADITGNSARAA